LLAKRLVSARAGMRGRWLLLQNNIRDGVPLLKRASEELEAQGGDMLTMEFVSDFGAVLLLLASTRRR
jgi:hypothetical protein